MEKVKGLLFRYRIWWHILFWVVWYFFYIITFSSNFLDANEFVQNLALLPVRMAATYVLLYWMLPNYLFTKHYLIFTLLMVAHGILYGLSINLVLQYGFGFRSTGASNLIRSVVLNYQIPATAVAVYLFKRWYRIQQYTLTLEKEKLAAELKFLKSQIHPHFLFNTLNNLYALTLKKSDKAPEVVIQLSHLLEYTLYSGRETYVELQEELKQLRDYIELEKLRYGKRLRVKLEISSQVDGLHIAPLMLLPFVENSFKHGASSDMEAPYIEIFADVQDAVLDFRIRNSYKPEKDKSADYKTGIGLTNVKRRLELLYPAKHKLEINNTSEVFEVLLHLNLNVVPS
jgi:two-component system, LytTR family, sensor kinase